MEVFDIDSVTTKLYKDRTYSTQDKMVLAVNAGFMTPEGKEIEMSELHTPKYHGGHVIPHKDGGPTTIENGVIQTAEDNWQLGGKPLKV